MDLKGSSWHLGDAARSSVHEKSINLRNNTSLFTGYALIKKNVNHITVIGNLSVKHSDVGHCRLAYQADWRLLPICLIESFCDEGIVTRNRHLLA